MNEVTKALYPVVERCWGSEPPVPVSFEYGGESKLLDNVSITCRRLIGSPVIHISFTTYPGESMKELAYRLHQELKGYAKHLDYVVDSFHRA